MKSLTVFLLLLSISFLASAQTWEELTGQVEQFYGQGKFAEALKYAEDALVQAEKEFGKPHANYGESLNNLVVLYLKMGQYEQVLPLAPKVLENTKKNFEKDHPEYGTRLNTLASYYTMIGQYEKALPLYLEMLKNAEKSVDKGHPDYSRYLNNLAVLYNKMGQYEKALPLYLEVLKNAEKSVDKGHPDYGRYLNNLAVLYKKMGLHEKALPLYLEVLEYAEGNYVIDGNQLNNLATLYLRMGQYEKAMPLYLEALKNTAQSVGKNHPDYGTFLSNLSTLYTRMGQYEKAFASQTEALVNAKKNVDKDHPDYGQHLNNLASLHQIMGQSKKALPLALEAMENTKNSLGTAHPDYGVRLNNLAAIHMAMDQENKALDLFIGALGNMDKGVGKEHPEYGLYQSNLAWLYKKIGRYEKALPLILEALENTEKSLGKEHLDYSIDLSRLALLYITMSQYEKALSTILEANKNVLQQVEGIFKFRSEQEKKEFLATVLSDFERYQSFALLTDDRFEKLTEMNLNNQLVLKGLLLNSTKDIPGKLALLDDEAIDGEIYSYRSLKKKLAKQNSLPISKRELSTDSLRDEINSTEANLVTIYNEFYQDNSSFTKDWKLVQANLQPEEIAIEFSHFRYYNKRGEATDSIMYCAYVIGPDYELPVMIPLFEETQLEDYLKRGDLDDDHSYTDRIYQGDDLYNLIWKPLDSLLQGVKVVHYAPSGLLHNLSFAAFKVEDGAYLSSHYHLDLLSTTGNLVSPKEKVDLANLSTSIYGGIQYDVDGDQMLSQAQAIKKTDNSLATRSITLTDDESRGGRWDSLEGSAEELARISRFLEKKKLDVQSFTGVEATEESFKYEINNTSENVIHIGTHGFFFPDIEKKKEDLGFGEQVFRYAEDPLFRSGLIMAGANRVWTGQEPIEGVDDGILTAYEVSNTDLSNTRLVVLSACETGLGDINGSEGVYGLQRAFKMAGVDYLIMSLWKVPDEQTMELMTVFYKYWLKGKAIKEAFSLAQNKMKKKYEPYYWAAFVLIE